MASGLSREVTEQGVPAEVMAEANQQLEKVAGKLYLEHMNPAWPGEVIALVSEFMEQASLPRPPLVLLDLVQYAMPTKGRSGEPMRGLPADHVAAYVGDILVGLRRLGARVALSSQTGNPKRRHRQGRVLFDHTDVDMSCELPKLFDHSVVLTPVDAKRRRTKPECSTPGLRSLGEAGSLAPDIIEAILRGDLSRRSRQAETGLSLEKLRKPALSAAEGNLPVRWDEQRERLVWPANR